MPVYYFMLGWAVFWGCISELTAKVVKIGDECYERRVNIFLAFITFSAVIFFAGLRSGVADTAAYIKMYDAYQVGFSGIFDTLKDSDQPGFILLSVFIKTYISKDYNVWFFIIASISGLSMIYGIYRYSKNFGMSAFLFMASCNFTWMFNGIRQYLVVSILFACTFLIEERKFIKYCIIVLILATIHKTAIVMIPVYFLAINKPWHKTTAIIIVGILLCMLFADKFLNVFTEVVESSSYAEGYKEIRKTDDGVNIMTIFVSLIPVTISFLFRKRLEKENDNEIMNIATNMSILATCMYIISKITRSGILVGRMAIYFTTYNLILLPWLIDKSFEIKERRLIKYIMIVCYIGLFYYQLNVAWNGLEYISKILNLKFL